MSVSNERASPLKALGGAVFLGLTGLVMGLLIGIIAIGLLNPFVTIQQGSALTSALTLVTTGVGLVGVGVVYLSMRDLSASYLRLRWPSLRDLAGAVAAIVVLFVVLAGLNLLVQQFGLSASDHSVAQQGQENPELLLPLIPLSVLVTGPAEEFLYRGVIQSRLREAFDPRLAVVLAALVFALVHVPAYGAGGGLDSSLVTTLGILLVLGVVLGAAYEYSGNLVVPAIAHGIYNAVVFGSLYVDATGGF